MRAAEANREAAQKQEEDAAKIQEKILKANQRKRLTRAHRFWLWLREKSTRKVREHILEYCGGLQTCTYCKQVVQEFPGSRFIPSEDYPGELPPQHEVLECGNCGGLTLWLWAVGMIYIGGIRPGHVDTWQDIKLKQLGET